MKPVPSPINTKFGKSYLSLLASEVDELCQWVYDTRDRGLSLGENTDKTVDPVSSSTSEWNI